MNLMKLQEISKNVENQERCFYKIAIITVAISVIECQT